MQTNKNIMLFLIQPILIVLLSSCAAFQKPPKVTSLPDSDQAYPSGSVANRFEEPTQQGRATEGPTIELSEKYVKLSEETAALRLKNQDIIAENRQLKEQIAALETELQKTERELTEANQVLMEMIVELDNWKNNVIGFREEMRGAEKTQLEALLKILKVLGGEVKAESVQGKAPQTQENAFGNVEAESSDAVSSFERAQPQLQETLPIGEPNE